MNDPRTPTHYRLRRHHHRLRSTLLPHFDAVVRVQRVQRNRTLTDGLQVVLRGALLANRLLIQNRRERTHRLRFDAAEEESRARLIVLLQMLFELLRNGLRIVTQIHVETTTANVPD